MPQPPTVFIAYLLLTGYVGKGLFLNRVADALGASPKDDLVHEGVL